MQDDAHGLRERLLEIARRDVVFGEFTGEREIPVVSGKSEPTGTLETRTTVIAFRTADGAIIAADSRATIGNQPSEGAVEKLFAVDAYSTFGISGFAGDGQVIARLIEREFERFANHFHPPHPKSKANRVAAYVRALGGCVPIFVTYDHSENRARIFSYDSAGFIQEMTNGYAATGSGSGPIRSQIEASAPTLASLPAIQAIPLVIYLLRQAARHDVYTGGDFFIHIVTANGIRAFTVPEALWRLDSVLGAAYDPKIERQILQKVLAYAEARQQKYAPKADSASGDGGKEGDAT